MKKNLLSSLLKIFVVACFLFLVQSCSKNNGSQFKTVTIYTPVYKNKAEVLLSINGNASTIVEHAGKLFAAGHYIFLNEVEKGIHIIDNSNPHHPVQVAFLAIPGNLDIVVKGNILYADMYNDLLALDITNLHQAKITNTINNFFTGRAYVHGYPANTEDKIATGWNEKDTVIDVTPYEDNCAGCEVFQAANEAVVPSTKSNKGTAGSMASMVLMNNHLYAITEMHSLGIVDVTNAASASDKSL